ncbi:hypothetical protein SAMD00024442_10_46 [Candidatus Symbiothrix dinenymphae]|nr:hypothetical protein SAMD00024442_10_46 [Candidatus Symbiothrix dinenymphae]
MRTKWIWLFGGVFVLTNLWAQKQLPRNQPYGDLKLYHFGISIGMNVQDVQLVNSGVATDGETWFATIPDYSPGFSVGLLADLYLNPIFNLRFSPSLNFGDKQFVFIEQATQETYTSTVRSNYLYFPLDLKIRTLRLNNYRPYIFTGVYGAVDLGRKTDEAIYMQPMDFGVSVGLGCDYYLPIIRVCPELRFSFGLKDMIDHKRTDLTAENLRKYTTAVSEGKTRMISLVFHFE